MRQFVDQRVEIADLAEIAIDRGEAHIGDLVERLQALHHQFADLRALDLALAGALELAHDAIDHALDALRIDRALAQGDLQRAHQLVAIEGHAAARFLDHDQLAQLHALESGETPAAIGTDAAAADRGRILGRTRVLHLGVVASRNKDSAWPHLTADDSAASLSPRAGRSGEGVVNRSGISPSTRGPSPSPRLPSRHFPPRPWPRARPAPRRYSRRSCLNSAVAEAARGGGRRAETDARGDEGLLRIEGHAVLVAGDVRAAERGFRGLAGQLLRAQIDEHQMIVGAAGDDGETGVDQRLRPASWHCPSTCCA